MESVMGIDQYGTTYYNLRFPRKDLMERIGVRSAKKMYVDKKSGEVKHIGYIVGGCWVRLYRVAAWEKDA